MIRLEVLADPFGKQRARHRPGGAPYTPAKTIREELRIRQAWQTQSGTTFEKGVPLRMTIDAYLRRPDQHYKQNGELSAAGLRTPHPTKRPDWDNAGKLVADALNGYAYHDDAQIVYAHVRKLWALQGEHPRTIITITTLA